MTKKNGVIIRFSCPHCNTSYRIGSDKMGREMKCPKCARVISVPFGAAAGAMPEPVTPARDAPGSPRGEGGLRRYLKIVAICCVVAVVVGLGMATHGWLKGMAAQERLKLANRPVSDVERAKERREAEDSTPDIDPRRPVAGEPMAPGCKVEGIGHYAPYRSERERNEDGIFYCRYFRVTPDDPERAPYDIWPVVPGELSVRVVGDDAGGYEYYWLDQAYEIREGGKVVHSYRPRGVGAIRCLLREAPGLHVSARTILGSYLPDRYALAPAAKVLRGREDRLRGETTLFMKGGMHFFEPCTAVVLMLENRTDAKVVWQVLPHTEMFAKSRRQHPAVAFRDTYVISGLVDRDAVESTELAFRDSFLEPELVVRDRYVNSELDVRDSYVTDDISYFIDKLDERRTYEIGPGGYCEIMYLFPGEKSPQTVGPGPSVRDMLVVTNWEPHR